MNQILVTEKIYVTPELRRKKKIFKIQFFLSVFLVCLLSSYYIYAEYDRNKSEEVSQEILSEIRFVEPSNTSNDTTIKTTNAIVVALVEDDEEEEQQVVIQNPIQTENTQAPNVSHTTDAGITYTAEAELNIPRLSINYPVLSETTEELLKISVNKYWGPKPNEVGNYCIVGHNYKNKKMFGRLSEIVDGDIIELTDTNGRTLEYAVYDKYIVNPTDLSCTSQLTNGKKEITLITCTNYGTQRLIVKARQVK